jgi:hypothetical protein
MNSVAAVSTKVGELHGRDAVYLEQLSQRRRSLSFEGEINGSLCTAEGLKNKWLGYRLSFFGVRAYECQDLDLCTWQLVSSFDEVRESEWLRELHLEGQCHHYFLATYDFVYRIAADRFEFEIRNERTQ